MNEMTTNKMIKAMHEKIHSLMVENQRLKTELIDKDRELNLEDLVKPLEHSREYIDYKSLELSLEFGEVEEPDTDLDLGELDVDICAGLSEFRFSY